MILFWETMRAQIGNNGWYLCDGRERPDPEYEEFRAAKSLALQWARQFRGDIFAMFAMRRCLGTVFPPMSDAQVIREVAQKLTCGSWVAWRRIVTPPASTAEKRQPSTAAFPIQARNAPPPPRSNAPPPDAALFPGDIDAEAIAAGQRQAALLGIPFCEECLRAQLAKAR